MRLVIRWSSPPWLKADRSPKVNRKALATRQERIRDLMLLSLGTAEGRDLPAHRELVALVRAAPRPESLLDRFPVISSERYSSERERFLNLNSDESGFQRFEYPQAPLPRTAILMEGFVETEKVMCFPEGWGTDLDRFRAECLAGPVAMLRRMAASVYNRGAHFPSVKRPIVAFTGLPFGDAGILTESSREQLRRAFNVPIYEYFLGHRNELLARECVEHAGLHIDPAQAVFEVLNPETSELVVTSLANSLFPVIRLSSGICATLTEENCLCGFRGQRLMNIRPLADQLAQPRIRVAMAGSSAAPPSHD